MTTGFAQHIQATADLIGALSSSSIEKSVARATDMLVTALKDRKPVLVFGNGGSSSDAHHIAGELVGRFFKERRAFNVIALSSNTSVLTAWSNDYDYESVFSRQVEAHAQDGGVAWGISTSGNSMNVVRAFEAARAAGMHTLGLTGQGGGKMAPFTDVLLEVPSRITPRVQELHVILYHYICEQVETALSA